MSSPGKERLVGCELSHATLDFSTHVHNSEQALYAEPLLTLPCKQREPVAACLFVILGRSIVFRVRIVITVAFEESPLAKQGDHGLVPSLCRNFACRFAVLIIHRHPNGAREQT